MKDKDYNSGGINKLSNIEHVRMYPAMYLGSKGAMGVFQTVKEIGANSVDECMGGYGNMIVYILESPTRFTIRDYGRGIPVDVNPKYGETGVELALQINTGGKYNKKNYNSAFGMHGVGMSATNCISKYMRVRVWKNGQIHMMESSGGHKTFPKKKGVLHIEGTCPKDRTGTEVTWEIDPEIMTETLFDPGKIVSYLKTSSYLNTGITFRFEDHRNKNDIKVTEFLSENGLLDFIEDIRGDKEAVIPKPILFSGDMSGRDKFEVAFTYSKDYKKEIHLYVNRNLVPNGGTAVMGFRMGLTKAVNDIAKLLGILKDKDKPFKTEDTDEGLIAVINLTMEAPEFEG